MKALFLSIALISLCIISFGFAALVSAEPDSEFAILSKYRPIDNSNLPTERIWVITTRRGVARTTVVRFLLQGKRTDEIFGELTTSDDSGTTTPTRWRAMNHDRFQEGVGKFLVMPGYPVPCDVLPRYSERRKEVYQQRREAGGQVFVKNYHLERETVPIEHALSQGWITDEGTHNRRALQLITVLDDRGRLVVRQLWPEGAAWWVYEETPFRQSWLVK